MLPVIMNASEKDSGFGSSERWSNPLNASLTIRRLVRN